MTSQFRPPEAFTLSRSKSGGILAKKPAVCVPTLTHQPMGPFTSFSPLRTTQPSSMTSHQKEPWYSTTAHHPFSWDSANGPMSFGEIFPVSAQTSAKPTAVKAIRKTREPKNPSSTAARSQRKNNQQQLQQAQSATTASTLPILQSFSLPTPVTNNNNDRVPEVERSLSDSSMIINKALARNRSNSELTPTGRVKKPRTTKGKAQGEESESMYRKQVSEREQLLYMNHKQTQRAMNRTEHSVTHYDPVSGNPLTQTTHVSEQEQQTTSDKVALEWSKEKDKLIECFSKLKSMSFMDAKLQSTAFKLYNKAISAEILTFRLLAKNELGITSFDNEDGRQIFENPRFVSRFLFSNRGIFDPEYDPKPGDPAWLACCWTMPEMIEFSRDVDVVNYYMKHKCAVKDYLYEPTFLVNPFVMSGYISGHMLKHLFPALQKLMRTCTRSEPQQVYFPTLNNFEIEEDCPVQLLYSYDFFCTPNSNVIPVCNANHCKPTDSCFLLGCNFECDGPLFQLFEDTSLRNSCYQVMEKIALERPKPTIASSQNDCLELQDWLTQERQKITQHGIVLTIAQ